MQSINGPTTYLLGLPGLYQNWLLSALDSNGQLTTDNQSNFICTKTRVKWIRKIMLSVNSLQSKEFCNNNDYVVNLYVEDKNFVWYLYNFLEKTDGVGIKINNLAQDLFLLAPETDAFDFMLKHFVNSYNINRQTDIVTLKNSLIEYFYFLLINVDSDFKKNQQRLLTTL